MLGAATAGQYVHAPYTLIYIPAIGVLGANRTGTVLTYGGAISGAMAGSNLVISGPTSATAGTVQLLGSASTYTGGTTIRQNATLEIVADGSLGTAPTAPATNLTFGQAGFGAGGTLVTDNSFVLNSNRTIAITAAMIATLSPVKFTTLTYGGIISGATDAQHRGPGNRLFDRCGEHLRRRHNHPERRHVERCRRRFDSARFQVRSAART